MALMTVEAQASESPKTGVAVVDVLLEYMDCTIRAAQDLDDRQSASELIARRIAERCETTYQRWAETMRGRLKPEEIMTNFETSLKVVEAGRSRHLLQLPN